MPFSIGEAYSSAGPYEASLIRALEPGLGSRAPCARSQRLTESELYPSLNCAGSNSDFLLMTGSHWDLENRLLLSIRST